MTPLADKVALVTGAGRGIGAAIARRLARDGAAVAVGDVVVAGAQETVDAITAEGGRAIALEHDVAARGSWEETWAHVTAELGSPSILINNAGVTRDRTLLKMTDQDWETVINVHLRGCFYGCQQALAAARARGDRWGRIINLSSQSSLGAFGQTNYAAAKAGIIGITKTVAMEGARFGVTCNAVAPGSIDTPMLREVPDEVLKGFVEETWLKRLGHPDEVAALAAFLASDEAAYITGQVIFIDGGATLG